MQLSDKIKKFSVGQAIDYLNRNPVKNLPKLIDLGCLFIWYFHYMPVGNGASPSRQPPQPRRSKERAQKADTRKNAKKHRLPTGRRCFCTHFIFTTRCRTTARAR